MGHGSKKTTSRGKQEDPRDYDYERSRGSQHRSQRPKEDERLRYAPSAERDSDYRGEELSGLVGQMGEVNIRDDIPRGYREDPNYGYDTQGATRGYDYPYGSSPAAGHPDYAPQPYYDYGQGQGGQYPPGEQYHASSAGQQMYDHEMSAGHGYQVHDALYEEGEASGHTRGPTRSSEKKAKERSPSRDRKKEHSKSKDHSKSESGKGKSKDKPSHSSSEHRDAKSSSKDAKEKSSSHKDTKSSSREQKDKGKGRSQEVDYRDSGYYQPDYSGADLDKILSNARPSNLSSQPFYSANEHSAPGYGLESRMSVEAPRAPEMPIAYKDEYLEADNVMGGPVSKDAVAEPSSRTARQLKNYKLYASSKFKIGTVFKIYWSEPRGNARTVMTVADESNGFYYGFRRFVVVGNAHGLSTCLPISTYGRQGCKKKGVDPRCHGQAYDDRSSRAPRLLEGEPLLGVEPISIKIDKDHDHERIEKESRINYAKFVSIEHNFPVLFIGKVRREDESILSQAAQDFFSENTSAT